MAIREKMRNFAHEKDKIRHMRKFLLMVIALLCLPLAGWVDGVRADEVAWTGVATEGELRTALLNNGASIQLTAVQDVSSNVDLKYGGASSGDIDARTKENEWDDIWD